MESREKKKNRGIDRWRERKKERKIDAQIERVSDSR
jgi:hypothetical protein